MLPWTFPWNPLMFPIYSWQTLRDNDNNHHLQWEWWCCMMLIEAMCKALQMKWCMPPQLSAMSQDSWPDLLGLGNDLLDGDQGHDIVLGNVGYAEGQYNNNGNAMLQEYALNTATLNVFPQSSWVQAVPLRHTSIVDFMERTRNNRSVYVKINQKVIVHLILIWINKKLRLLCKIQIETSFRISCWLSSSSWGPWPPLCKIQIETSSRISCLGHCHLEDHDHRCDFVDKVDDHVALYILVASLVVIIFLYRHVKACNHSHHCSQLFHSFTVCNVSQTASSWSIEKFANVCFVWAIISNVFVGQLQYCTFCRPQKCPRSSTFRSGLFGGWFLIVMLICNSWHFASNSGESVKTERWGVALSC